MPEHTTKEEVIEYIRNAPEKERWVWLAGELHDGRTRMDQTEQKIASLPCKEWHGQFLKWFITSVLGGAIVALGYAILSHVLKGLGVEHG